MPASPSALTSVYQAKPLAQEELLLLHAQVLLEETVQNTVVEMLTSSFKTLATCRLLLIRLVELIA
jgi:hypothetical protein